LSVSRLLLLDLLLLPFLGPLPCKLIVLLPLDTLLLNARILLLSLSLLPALILLILRLLLLRLLLPLLLLPLLNALLHCCTN